MSLQENAYDYVIVGGGLQGCLVAHALACHRPDATVLLIERGEELCGNHTWSFHESDVPEGAEVWLEKIEAIRWPSYRVKFPGYERRVSIPYLTIPSDTLRRETEQLADRSAGRLTIRRGVDCEIESATTVAFADGVAWGGLVIDCTGLRKDAVPAGGCGFQAFVGEEYELSRPWPVEEPAVMDARKDQQHGFEFLYELPLGPDRVLLEYTRFSDEPGVDEGRARALIENRLAEVGEERRSITRKERGCLPMPYMPFGDASPGRRDVVTGGYAGGWFHAATGYSVPLALRFAETVARTDPAEVAETLNELTRADRPRARFARFLNRLLFRLVGPKHRWKIFRRFYRVLPDTRIERFYGYRFTVTDALRIVIGWPPTGLRP
ncbi:MAG: lycopene beta-cyclase CrtY, partial [Planctomycetota bacterium]